MTLWLPWSRLGSFIRFQFASGSPLCFLPWPATNLLSHATYFTPHLGLAQPVQLWSLPSGYTMSKVFVLELFLLLPQRLARAVTLSCLLLPLLIKKKRKKKQPKPQLPWDPTANPWELALIIKFTEGTSWPLANTMVNQNHNDLHSWSLTSREHYFQAGLYTLKGKYWKLKVCLEEGDKFVNCWNRNGAKHRLWSQTELESRLYHLLCDTW